MSRLLAISALGIASLVPAAVPAQAAYYHHHHYHSRVMQTVKRVGIGAAGGAAIGAIAGGGPGAAIGAIAGGGAGAIYDRHEKNHGH
jgi:uncharacterized membrane protein